MRRLALLCLAALGALALSGCGSDEAVSAPGKPITSVELRNDPCSGYRGATLVSIMSSALREQGWPRMGPAGAVSRISGNVQRCAYRLQTANAKLNGDQVLNVFIYNEMGNGSRLMAACHNRPLAGAGVPAIGDESCVDDTGQVRFRVGQSYASVLIDLPPRTESNEQPITPGDTTTFVARDDPASRAALAEPVAQDLARRMR